MRSETRFGIKHVVQGHITGPSGVFSESTNRLDHGAGVRPATSCDGVSGTGGEDKMKEHDLVVLKAAVAEHGLEAGDIGTVVHLYRDGTAAEVEFARADGTTVAVVTLEAAKLRPFAGSEILHVRELAS